MNEQPGQPTPSGTTPSGLSVPAAVPALDLKVCDARPLPRCFASLALELPDEAIAKLRALDTTRAMVAFKPRGGGQTQFMPLAMFMADFPAEAAAELGTGGPMLAIVEPNDGRLEKFCFGFVAPGEVKAAQAGASREVAELREYIKALAQQQQETMKLIMLAGGGNGGGQGNSLDQQLVLLDKLTAVMQRMMPPAPPAQDPAKIAEGMAAMANGMGNAMGAMLNNAKTLTEQAKSLGQAQAPSIAQEIKEVMSIPGAPDLAKQLASGVFNMRSGNSGKGPLGGDNGGAPASADAVLDKVG